MRKLSDHFMHALTDGDLTDLCTKAIADPDLDLEIRKDYINLYFNGKSLLRLKEDRQGVFLVDIHPAYRGSLDIPGDLNPENAAQFIKLIPGLKENILANTKPTIEVEYEQLIIRANNYEPRNNSEYFIVDRQITAGVKGRFDMTGFYWPRQKRRKEQTVAPCLFEIKAALNQDIQDVYEQLMRYYEAVCVHPQEFAAEMETVLRQKLELGLYKGSQERIEAMKTLTIAQDIEQFLFILVLVDYNPYSKLFERAQEHLRALPFAKQIKLFCGGFGMWEPSFRTVNEGLNGWSGASPWAED